MKFIISFEMAFEETNLVRLSSAGKKFNWSSGEAQKRRMLRYFRLLHRTTSLLYDVNEMLKGEPNLGNLFVGYY
jgi:hypothetical protein